MDKEVLKPLARRLKCAYLSYHLNISLAYCMKRYVDRYEIEKYWYEMAGMIWADNNGQPRKFVRSYTFEDWARLGKGVGLQLVSRRDLFTAQFGRQPTPDDPFFFDPTNTWPVPIPHDHLLHEFIENRKVSGQTPEQSLAFFYQIFRFPIEGPKQNPT